MSVITDFRLSLIPFAPDAPEVVLQLATKYAVRKVMRDTFVAQDESTATTQSCVLDYLLNTPDCRTIERVHRVTVDGREVRYEMDGPNLALRLKHAPPAGKEIIAYYSWSTSKDDCEVPDYMFTMFEDAVRYAALAYIHLMPKEEWSSAERVRYFDDQYSYEKSQLRTRVLRKFSSSTMMMKAPAFARGAKRVSGARSTGGRGWPA